VGSERRRVETRDNSHGRLAAQHPGP
jgi:hypothetical protein